MTALFTIVENCQIAFVPTPEMAKAHNYTAPARSRPMLGSSWEEAT